MRTGPKRWGLAIAGLVALVVWGRSAAPGTEAKRFRHSLSKWPAPPQVPHEVAGVVIPQPETCASRFRRFPPAKPAGIQRIGVFGGSQVLGAESAPGFDFPSLLERQLRSRGRSVQVLNFGHAWQSLAQSYRLAKTMIPSYGLDYVVLSAEFAPAPEGFLGDPLSYGPVQPRLVVAKNGALEWIRPSAENPADAAEAYHRWIPPWRYWRFDRRLPAVFSLLPERFRPRKNPFYYFAGSSDEEFRQVTRAMLADLARSGAEILLHSSSETLTQLGRAIAPNVYAWTSQVDPTRLPFLYHATNGHLSSLGNELRAREIADLLTGKSRPDLSHFKPRLLESGLRQLAAVPPRAVASAKFAFGDRPLGRFALLPPGRSPWEMQPAEGEAPAALLFVADRPDWVFSLSAPLEGPQSVRLRAFDGRQERTLPTGTIRVLSGSLAAWKPTADPAEPWEWKDGALWIRSRRWLRASLWVGGECLLEGRFQGAGLRLTPPPKHAWFARLSPPFFAGAEPPSRRVDLAWKELGGEPRQVTLYELEPVEPQSAPFAPFSRPL